MLFTLRELEWSTVTSSAGKTCNILNVPKSMAKNPPPSLTALLRILLLLLLLLITAPTPTHSSDFQNQTAVSLAHSLMKRVADLRHSRGDSLGSDRAQQIGKQLERGLWTGLLSFMWAVSRESAENYAWKDLTLSELRAVVSEMSGFLRCRTEADAQKVACVGGKKQKFLNISKFLFTRLMKFVNQSETLKKVLNMVETEVVEGKLLIDCLELGRNELIQMFPNWLDNSRNCVMSTNSEEPEVIEDPDDSKRG